jgi:hypothetical protein
MLLLLDIHVLGLLRLLDLHQVLLLLLHQPVLQLLRLHAVAEHGRLLLRCCCSCVAWPCACD